jgi:putative ABC transport system permease protein
VALLVGIIVTLVSALSPALRATRVSPMAALREAELPESRRRGRIVTAVAVVLGLGGLGLTALGIFGGAESNTAAVLVGGGAASTLLGVSLFSPRLVRPLASVAGWPLERVRGLTGRLARENTVRKPGRTATTAAALMIGLAVVVFVTVFAAGISESVGKTIDRNFQGDVVLQNTDGFSPIPAGAAREAAKVDGVGTVGSLSYAGAERNGKNIRVAGVDPATANDIFSLDWKNGDPSTLDDLGPRDAVVDDAWAKGQDIDVGDEVKMITPLEKRVSFTVAGSVKDNADLLGNMVITEDSLRKDFGTKSPSLTLLTLAPGASADQVQKAVGDAIEARYPTVETLNQEELKDKQEEQINQLVAFFYVLLALAIVISLLGIVTTLVLSIHERTRELGMLRAVGMSRRQVRTMVRYEAVITALIGAVLGMGLGIIFAALMSAPLADEGFVLAYPVPTLVILLLLAALAGVFAAIWPGGGGGGPGVS